MNVYDAIVLGTGGVGSAALFHLARRGMSVVGIDRFAPPHDRGSSHGHTRVIRQAYFEHPDYVPLALAAYDFWNELEELVGRRLFFPSGLIQVGPADGTVLSGVIRSAESHDLAVDRLTGADIHSRWPGLVVSDDVEGVYEPRAGYLLAEQCVQSHIEAARQCGAELRSGCTVVDWTSQYGQVSVRTTTDELIAKILVIAQGAWSVPLLASCGVMASVRRKSLFWFRCDDAAYVADSGLPVFLFELPNGVFYGWPKLDDRGVKVGEHSGGQLVADPLQLDRSQHADEAEALAEFLSRCLPGVTHEVTDHTVCMYTMSPDEHFVLDRHPEHDNVVFVAGLSGHGFKFTPVLGRALAELAVEGFSELPVGFLSLARFQQT